jgi:putative Ca2+/H+ antiporter (TMEM165/GDT1 family)
VAGSTLGIMVIDIPVVIFSATAAWRLPHKPLRLIIPAVFLGLGIASLLR